MLFYLLLISDCCDTVLYLLSSPSADTYCHLYLSYTNQFVLHDHDTLEWLLIRIPWFGLLD